MTDTVNNRIRQAYQKVPYTPTREEWDLLMKDNDHLRAALGEAVSQVQQLQAQLDYTRALHSNLDNRG